MKTIVLDPGHFGSHNQGVAVGYWESKFNLAYAFLLEKELKALGWRVILTRRNETDLSLTARGRIAGNAHADVFYSIHSNACGDRDVRGVGCFYSVDRPGDLAVAKSQADLVAHLMGSPKSYAKYRASTIQHSSPDPSPLEDYYTVIDVASDMGVKHVILLEHDFHTNATVCRWLSAVGSVPGKWSINLLNCVMMAKAEAANIQRHWGDVTVEPPPVIKGTPFVTTATCYTLWRIHITQKVAISNIFLADGVTRPEAGAMRPGMKLILK